MRTFLPAAQRVFRLVRARVRRIPLVVLASVFLGPFACNEVPTRAVPPAETIVTVDGGSDAKGVRSIRLRLDGSFASTEGDAHVPLQFGVPFAPGELASASGANVRFRGSVYPADLEVASRYHWNGSSIRWLTVRTAIDVPAAGYVPAANDLSLELLSQRSNAAKKITVTKKATANKDDPGTFTIATPAYEAVVACDRGTLVESLRVDANGDGSIDTTPVFTAPATMSSADIQKWGSSWYGRHKGGQAEEWYASSWKRPDVCRVEFDGEQSAIVTIEGAYSTASGIESGRYSAHLSFFAGAPSIGIQFSHIFTEDTIPSASPLCASSPFDPTTCGQFTLRQLGLGMAFGATLGTTRTLKSTVFDINDSSPISTGSHTNSTTITGSGLLLQQVSPHAFAKGTSPERGRLGGGFSWADTAKVGSATSVSVAVRNFWQSYPKAIELTRESVRYYLWRPSPDTLGSRSPTREDYFRFWHLHQGDVLADGTQALTLQPRESMALMDPDLAANDSITQVPFWQEINARGISITSDVLLSFGTGAEATALAYGADSGPPLVIVDPSQLAKSGVFGQLETAVEDFDTANPVARWAEDQSFTRALHSKLEWLRYGGGDLDGNYADGNYGDFGAFNYGDVHTLLSSQSGRADDNNENVSPCVDEPSLYFAWDNHRIWAGFHHQIPRVPLLAYARTGSPSFLRWGLNNLRHILDLDVTHYGYKTKSGKTPGTDLQYVKVKDWDVYAKCTGGMNDYKGVYHWSRGCRAFEYNSVLDAPLWAYYLTADLRARDVAGEMVTLNKEVFDTSPDFGSLDDGTGGTTKDVTAYPLGSRPRDREVDGRISFLLDAYEAFDNLSDTPPLIRNKDGSEKDSSYASWLGKAVAANVSKYIDTKRDDVSKAPLRWTKSTAGFSQADVPPAYTNIETTDPTDWAWWPEYVHDRCASAAPPPLCSFAASKATVTTRTRELMREWVDAEIAGKQVTVPEALPLNLYALAYEGTGNRAYLEAGLRRAYASVTGVLPNMTGATVSYSSAALTLPNGTVSRPEPPRNYGTTWYTSVFDGVKSSIDVNRSSAVNPTVDCKSLLNDQMPGTYALGSSSAFDALARRFYADYPVALANSDSWSFLAGRWPRFASSVLRSGSSTAEIVQSAGNSSAALRYSGNTTSGSQFYLQAYLSVPKGSTSHLNLRCLTSAGDVGDSALGVGDANRPVPTVTLEDLGDCNIDGVSSLTPSWSTGTASDPWFLRSLTNDLAAKTNSACEYRLTVRGPKRFKKGSTSYWVKTTCMLPVSDAASEVYALTTCAPDDTLCSTSTARAFRLDPGSAVYFDWDGAETAGDIQTHSGGNLGIASLRQTGHGVGGSANAPVTFMPMTPRTPYIWFPEESTQACASCTARDYWRLEVGPRDDGSNSTLYWLNGALSNVFATRFGSIFEPSSQWGP